MNFEKRLYIFLGSLLLIPILGFVWLLIGAIFAITPIIALISPETIKFSTSVKDNDDED